MNWVDTDYFRTMGIPLIAGRWFDEHVTGDGTAGCGSQRNFGAALLPGAESIGQTNRPELKRAFARRSSA